MPKPAVMFKDAADVAAKMKVVAEAWKETPIMTGVSLRSVIPMVEAMATLADEIESIKSRLPPPHGLNGAHEKRRK
jgi:hypothetical protein